MKLAIAATNYILRLDDGHSISAYPGHYHTVSIYRGSSNLVTPAQRIRDVHYWRALPGRSATPTDILSKSRAFYLDVLLLSKPEAKNISTERIPSNLRYFRTETIFARLARNVPDDGCMIGPNCVHENRGPYLVDDSDSVIGHVSISSHTVTVEDIAMSDHLELVNLGGMEVDWKLWAA
ncbi:hypothetical protein E8E11_009928 [Didymella keratinophila]|nr:hypothetical protein E8E11_009928 [Didymella keratinophila]